MPAVYRNKQIKLSYPDNNSDAVRQRYLSFGAKSPRLGYPSSTTTTTTATTTATTTTPTTKLFASFGLDLGRRPTRSPLGLGLSKSPRLGFPVTATAAVNSPSVASPAVLGYPDTTTAAVYSPSLSSPTVLGYPNHPVSPAVSVAADNIGGIPTEIAVSAAAMTFLYGIDFTDAVAISTSAATAHLSFNSSPCLQFLGDSTGLEPYDNDIDDTFVDFMLFDDIEVPPLENMNLFPSLR